jgi:hypothetical protein
MASGGRLDGRGWCSRYAPQTRCQNDPREHEGNGSHEEHKALIICQRKRGQPRNGANDCRDGGCCGAFKVQVDGIKDDGFPRRRRSGSSRPRPVVIAPVIHGVVPLTWPTAAAGCGQKHRSCVLEVAR